MYSKCNVKTQSFSFKLAQVISTFLLVDFAWIFFRAGSIGQALEYAKRIFSKWDPWNIFNGELYNLGLDRMEINILVVSLVILFLVDLVRYFKKMQITDFLNEQCIWFRWSVVMALIAAVLVFGIYGIKFESAQFIYFQF